MNRLVDDTRREGKEELGGLPSAPACPFCEGHETELMSAFGSHASVATYWCRSCRSPFEMLKWKSGGGDRPRTARM